MSEAEVDAYLAAAPEPQRSTLVAVRQRVAALLPDAEQTIAYGIACFKVDGVGVAGFGSYAHHCAFFPMSGSITAALAGELDGFATTKGSVKFAIDEPLPADVIRALVQARQLEIADGAR